MSAATRRLGRYGALTLLVATVAIVAIGGAPLLAGTRTSRPPATGRPAPTTTSTSPPSTTTTAPVRWSLVDLADHRCAQLGSGSSPGSYAVELNGHWNHTVTVGMDALPPGVTATALQSPIPPGSSDGTQELAYVRIDVARRQAVPGAYSMALWATDGSTRQVVPVTLVIQTTRCTTY